VARVVGSDRDRDGGEPTADLVARVGGQARALQAEVTASSDVESLVARAGDAFGRLDYAFNNAGV